MYPIFSICPFYIELLLDLIADEEIFLLRNTHFSARSLLVTVVFTLE